MEHKNGDIIEYKCKHCGCETSKIRILKDVFIVESAICTSCGKILYSKKIGETGKQRPEWIHNAQCPYCKSYNTKKISTVSKAGHAALLGVLAMGKLTKQWHCNTCKSDF